MPRRLAAAVVLSAALLLLPAPASAHEDLASSDPAPDQVLASPPTAITLTFTAEPLDIGTAVRVVDPAGADRTSGPPVLSGASVVTPLQPDLPDGAYEVRWRVVSSDGHPIQGVIPFQVGAAQASPTDGVVAPDEPDADPAPAARAESDTAESGTTTGDDVAAGSASLTPPLRSALVALAGSGVAVVLGALLLPLPGRRRTAPSRPGPASTPSAAGTPTDPQGTR